jgi:hypothetical protein
MQKMRNSRSMYFVVPAGTAAWFSIAVTTFGPSPKVVAFAGLAGTLLAMIVIAISTSRLCILCQSAAIWATTFSIISVAAGIYGGTSLGGMLLFITQLGWAVAVAKRICADANLLHVTTFSCFLVGAIIEIAYQTTGIFPPSMP